MTHVQPVGAAWFKLCRLTPVTDPRLWKVSITPTWTSFSMGKQVSDANVQTVQLYRIIRTTPIHMLVFVCMWNKTLHSLANTSFTALAYSSITFPPNRADLGCWKCCIHRQSVTVRHNPRVSQNGLSSSDQRPSFPKRYSHEPGVSTCWALGPPGCLYGVFCYW